MTDKQKLKQLLDQPQVPEMLAQKIRANWRQQQLQQRRRKPMIFAWAASVAALALTLMVFVKPNTGPSDLINFALEDIANDAEKHVAISVPLDGVYQLAQIHQPPPSMPIEMSKTCYLGNNKTTHLKIAGARQGVVHLFIKQGDFNAVFVDATRRQAFTMPWRLLKPRKDLTVLVLYSQDMNPNSVDTLLKTMFYA